MSDFLRENWIWIVLPLVLVVLVFGLLLFFTESDGTAPFIYNL